MINLLLGGPRSGKSYEATAYHVLPALESGRMVITNLPLNLEAFYALNPAYRDLIRIVEWDGKVRPFSLEKHWHSDWKEEGTGRGPLFVVDECQDVMRKGETPRWLQDLAAMHGHYGYDWLLITQAHGKIDKDVKDMVQFTYYVRKKLAWGQPDRYIRKVYDGLRANSNSQEIQINERQYLPAYFKLYKSHTHSAQAVDEFTGSDVSSRYTKWRVATFAIFGICLFCLLGAGYSVFTKKGKKSAPVSQASPQASAPVAQVKNPDYVVRAETPAQMEKPPLDGMKIHIRAYMENKKKTFALFTVSRDGQPVMNQTGEELAKAGYSIRVVNDCLMIVDHPKASRPWYVYCDLPQGETGAGQEPAKVSFGSPSSALSIPGMSSTPSANPAPSQAPAPTQDQPAAGSSQYRGHVIQSRDPIPGHKPFE